MNYAVKRVLDEFEANKLYGSVEVKYQDGRVVLVKTTKTIVPNDRNERSGDYEKP